MTDKEKFETLWDIVIEQKQELKSMKQLVNTQQELLDNALEKAQNMHDKILYLEEKFSWIDIPKDLGDLPKSCILLFKLESGHVYTGNNENIVYIENEIPKYYFPVYNIHIGGENE